MVAGKPVLAAKLSFRWDEPAGDGERLVAGKPALAVKLSFRRDKPEWYEIRRFSLEFTL